MTPTTLHIIGVTCITIAVILELASYYKQVAKTLRTKKSGNVSSSAYMYKLAKYIFTIIALMIYSNWVGVGIEVAALIMCVITLWIICRYKPRGWRLF
jgi:uncharacterized protein with PQ loop repeat